MKALRERKNLSQMDLVRLLDGVRGFHQGNLSRLESGIWMPDAGQMEMLLHALGATEVEAFQIRVLARQEAAARPAKTTREVAVSTPTDEVSTPSDTVTDAA